MSTSANALVSFAALLKRHRRGLGYTQEQLAAESGYTAAYISMLERGERAPIETTAKLLAAALGLAGAELADFLRAASEALARRRLVDGASGATGSQTPPPRLPPAPGDRLERASRGRMVAREAELGALASALESALSGTGRFIALAGEPGIGKSQLAQEVAQQARARGMLVGIGRCYERQQAVAYAPFTEALGSLEASATQEFRDETRQRWPLLCRVLPERAETPATALPLSESTGPDDQGGLWWQTQGFLRALAATRPVLLVLDDIHWADVASLQLLEHLARHVRDMPVVILCMYRDTELHARPVLRTMLSELRREGLMERTSLSRLTLHETMTLAAIELNGVAIADELGEELQRTTEGNPFFTLEVLRLLHQRGDLVLQGDRWQRREPGPLEAPETVRDATRERVERLNPSTQAALEAASVLGQEFTYASLWRMGERLSAEAMQLGEALDEAFVAGFIREAQHDGHGDVRYSFSHALAQRAIYTAIPTPRRRRLHLAAGEALEAVAPHQRATQATLVATHFLQGDAVARALPYILDSGQYAARLFAWSEAERQYELAAELARELGDRAREAEALGKRAEALTLMGRHDEALVTFEAANTLHLEAGHLDQLAWNVACMTRTYASLARTADGLAHLTAVLALLAATASQSLAERQTTQPLTLAISAMHNSQASYSLAELQSLAEQAAAALSPRSVTRVYHSLTVYHFFMGRHEEAIAFGSRAVTHAQTSGDPDTLLRAAAFYGLSLLESGRIGEAMETFQQARVTAERVGDLETLYLAAGNLGEIYRLRGEFDLATREADIARDAAERTCIPDLIMQARCGSGAIAFYAGRWADARQFYESAEEIVRASGGPASYSSWAHQGALLLAEGQTHRAHTLLSAAIAQAEQHHDLEALRLAHGALAEEELLLRQVPLASQRLEDLINGPETNGSDRAALIALHAWALANRGEFAQAQPLIRQALTRLTDLQFHLALADALRIQALLAMREERWQEAEQALERSRRLATNMAVPYAEAKALYVSGLLSRQRGDLAQAQGYFQLALHILNQLGERLYAEQVAQALQALA